jgi:hypothetical protein
MVLKREREREKFIEEKNTVNREHILGIYREEFY